MENLFVYFCTTSKKEFEQKFEKYPFQRSRCHHPSPQKHICFIERAFWHRKFKNGPIKRHLFSKSLILRKPLKTILNEKIATTGVWWKPYKKTTQKFHSAVVAFQCYEKKIEDFSFSIERRKTEKIDTRCWMCLNNRTLAWEKCYQPWRMHRSVAFAGEIDQNSSESLIAQNKLFVPELKLLQVSLWRRRNDYPGARLFTNVFQIDHSSFRASALDLSNTSTKNVSPSGWDTVARRSASYVATSSPSPQYTPPTCQGSSFSLWHRFQSSIFAFLVKSFADSSRGWRTAEFHWDSCETLAALHPCGWYVDEASKVTRDVNTVSF